MVLQEEYISQNRQERIDLSIGLQACAEIRQIRLLGLGPALDIAQIPWQTRV